MKEFALNHCACTIGEVLTRYFAHAPAGFLGRILNYSSALTHLTTYILSHLIWMHVGAGASFDAVCSEFAQSWRSRLLSHLGWLLLILRVKLASSTPERTLTSGSSTAMSKTLTAPLTAARASLTQLLLRFILEIRLTPAHLLLLLIFISILGMMHIAACSLFTPVRANKVRAYFLSFLRCELSSPKIATRHLLLEAATLMRLLLGVLL